MATTDDHHYHQPATPAFRGGYPNPTTINSDLDIDAPSRLPTTDIEAQPLVSSSPQDPTPFFPLRPATPPAPEFPPDLKDFLLGTLAFFTCIVLFSLAAAFCAYFLKFVYLFWRWAVVGAFASKAPEAVTEVVQDGGEVVTTLVGEVGRDGRAGPGDEDGRHGDEDGGHGDEDGGGDCDGFGG
ncbi:hypothetical protein MMC27_002868 [Xylographa pallens]|nr:hypothetical protein [Xylographa pallens]